MKDMISLITGSTGILGTGFCITAMLASSLFLWNAPQIFTADNWLSALSTCALLMGAVIGKRALDNTKLSKPGTGDGGA
jgi:hypothetical protein